MARKDNMFDIGPNQNIMYTAFLKAVKLHTERERTSEVLLPENINVFVNDVPDETARKLTMELLMAVQHLEKVQTHSLPATPWELFKHYCFPRWLKRSFPVKLTHYVLEAKAYYPDIIVDRKAETQLYITKRSETKE